MRKLIWIALLLCGAALPAHAQDFAQAPQAAQGAIAQASQDGAQALENAQGVTAPEPNAPEPVFVAPAEGIGSSDWQFDVSKAIAAELADTPAWSLAIGYLREISPKTQDWNLLLLQTKIDLQQGDVASAQEGISRAIQAHPTNPRIIEMAGHVAADAGDFETAAAYYHQVLALNPRNATQIKLSLARIEFAQKKYSDVIGIYESVLSEIQPTSEILVRLSACYENIGDIEHAEYYLKSNLEVHPNRLLALLPLERFYKRHQMQEQADRIARERESLQKNDNTRELRALQKSAR